MYHFHMKFHAFSFDFSYSFIVKKWDSRRIVESQKVLLIKGFNLTQNAYHASVPGGHWVLY